MRPLYRLLAFRGSGQPGIRPTEPRLTGDPLLSDTEIRKILIDRIDVLHKCTGMVVGIVTPTGRRISGYGRVAGADSQPP
jgi:hypothetical protein